jgi:hypothetical protein
LHMLKPWQCVGMTQGQRLHLRFGTHELRHSQRLLGVGVDVQHVQQVYKRRTKGVGQAGVGDPSHQQLVTELVLQMAHAVVTGIYIYIYIYIQYIFFAYKRARGTNTRKRSQHI